MSDSLAPYSNSEIVIQVENVSKTFQTSAQDKVGALENISLDIRAGEFITVVGPSGCGKSTLIKLIAGLVSLSAGRITCQGEAVRGLNTRVGYVPQESKLFPWLTVEDNVAFGLVRNGNLPIGDAPQTKRRLS